MWTYLVVLLLITAVCAIVGLRRVSKALCVRLSPAAFGVFAFAAIFATCEAQKRLLHDGGTGSATQQVVVTHEEITQGYRLESIATNETVSYSMPTNGVEYMPWSGGGAYEAHFPLDLGDFTFPFGTNVVRRIDVVSGGMVDSLPRPSCMSICAAREYASIVPGVGRFWWTLGTRDTCPYREMLLTWESVYAGRDRTGLYNAQIELCRNGNFITRSNNVERVYRRVLPYDLDNDGLPNDIDPAPETPLVPSAWNQSEAWAMVAFPSNAAEIAAMGGYAAWAASLAADPDRRLVSFDVTFDEGSAWPTMLDLGGVPVVADGREELAFAIDCGARVPFTLTSGRIASVEVTATLPPMRSGGIGTTTSRELFPLLYSYPYERMVGDVKIHFDGPRSGWLCRVAGVDVVPGQLPHFYPGDSAELTATLSGCHTAACLGCSWIGGAGLQFSDPHSLSTTVTYGSDAPDLWATNGIVLVTRFLGYSLTNHVFFTVGVCDEPQLDFSLECQKVFFLNDAELGSSSNRTERIRPVTLNLTGPLGTNGTARLSVQGNVNPVLFQVVNGVTNRVTAETEFPLAVTNDFEHTGSATVYVSCPNIGTGTITATFTPVDGDDPLTDSVTFRCIEPLRKLVTTEKKDGRYVNPSRLVIGTNAVLKVGANGQFSPSEVEWRLVSGAAQLASDGWYATVTPTGTDTVIVEAHFNDDEVQPRFMLPVVQPRTIPVKALVATYLHGVPVTSLSSIQEQIRTANIIFSQVGVAFELQGQPEYIQGTNALDLTMYEIHEEYIGEDDVSYEEYTPEFMDIVKPNRPVECLEVYYIGKFRYSTGRSADSFALCLSQKIIMPKDMDKRTLAHELGHSFGLQDIYINSRYGMAGESENWVELENKDEPVSRKSFGQTQCDWGNETGRGFYEREDSHAVAIQSLMMYGIDDDSGILGDIPDGDVWGLPDGAKRAENARFIWVGAQKIDE